jgi:DnaK suppressor protein
MVACGETPERADALVGPTTGARLMVMTARELEELRRAMQARARDILLRSHVYVETQRANLGVRTDLEDIGEPALRDEALATWSDPEERDRQVLVAIREAFDRMRDGTYGACIDRGDPIGIERLRSLPRAPRCAEDRERAEAALGRDVSPTL